MSQPETMRVYGHEIRVGDILHGWFGSKQVLQIETYKGPLSHLFPRGARIAEWAPRDGHRSRFENTFSLPGMTIPNDEFFEVSRVKGSVAE